MKNKKVIFICILVICILAIVVFLIFKNMDRKAKVQEEQENFKIVTSFYPIYIMTKNITYGAEDVKLSNMADVNGGCLHDYTLIANDVKKVENADVFIQNGEGIENFIDKILETYSNVNIINSSEGIKELIQDNDEINGHIWTSLENYKKQLENIASKLSEYNSENAEIYNKNKEEYIKKLDELENKYKMELQNLSGENAVCLNEAFAYFGRDLNLDMIMVETDHEESTLSADALREVVNQVKEKNIKIIIIGEGDNTKNAETIEAETGAKTYILKTGLSGDYSLDSYLQDMEYNLEILKTISTN